MKKLIPIILLVTTGLYPMDRKAEKVYENRDAHFKLKKNTNWGNTIFHGYNSISGGKSPKVRNSLTLRGPIFLENDTYLHLKNIIIISHCNPFKTRNSKAKLIFENVTVILTKGNFVWKDGKFEITADSFLDVIGAENSESNFYYRSVEKSTIKSNATLTLRNFSVFHYDPIKDEPDRLHFEDRKSKMVLFDTVFSCKKKIKITGQIHFENSHEKKATVAFKENFDVAGAGVRIKNGLLKFLENVPEGDDAENSEDENSEMSLESSGTSDDSTHDASEDIADEEDFNSSDEDEYELLEANF